MVGKSAHEVSKHRKQKDFDSRIFLTEGREGKAEGSGLGRHSAKSGV
jgi:hypothetical protein